MAKPKILVTNDDGIYSNGIKALVSVLSDLGDITVVAPKLPQSGMGHAITINATLRCDKVVIDAGPQLEYAVSGTPVDCVKLAVNQILESDKFGSAPKRRDDTTSCILPQTRYH